jgi:hypothetical protein
MKPWIAFVGGAVLAGTIALVVATQKGDEAPLVAPEAISESMPAGSDRATPEAVVEPVATLEQLSPPPAVKPPEPPAAPRRPPTRKAVRKPAPAPTVQQQQPVAVAQTTPAAVEQPAAPTPAYTVPVEVPPPNAPAEPAKAPEPPPPPNRVTIAAGTQFPIRLVQAISAERLQGGESFQATLDQPLVVDGFVLAERGSRVTGRVVTADPGGRVKGVSSMSLELTNFRTADGQTISIATGVVERLGEKSTKSDATKVAVGAGIGAALGAIFGGGKGAAVGAASGGAAGTGVVLATRGKPVVLPAESRLTFRLKAPVTVTEAR